ncbi:MAG: NAD(P)/FAD-dependent oxidoreductase, partial [Cellulomonadaceae bacterium]|nr:NAD(P)/FAD-dependent oxidoreductase [Cellulomonadaceae bacterium]
MSTPTTVHDLIIVGSGPAGYTAGIYAGRAGFSPLILAGSITAGGALMNTLEVENFPGFPDGILGPDLMAKMQEQAEKFGADIEFDDAVTLDLDGDVKTITTGSEETYQARTVLLALGSEYRHLGVDGEERLAGRGV